MPEEEYYGCPPRGNGITPRTILDLMEALLQRATLANSVDKTALLHLAWELLIREDPAR